MVNYQDCFVKNLKYYRKRKGISQQTLAELCDVSSGTIGNIESKVTKPSFDLIIQIAEKLEITPDKLFTMEETNIKGFTDRQIDKITSKLQQYYKKETPALIENFIKELKNL